MRGEPFEVLGLGDDGDALLGDGQAAGEVGLAVPADLEAGGDLHVLVDDRAADPGVAADLDAVEEDRVLDQGEAVDPDARARGCSGRPGRPETIAPWQTIELNAAPRRSASVWTNLGGGIGGW